MSRRADRNRARKRIMAMTKDDRNARRRELDRDPFHRALTRKTARAWRERNWEKLNAIRRDRYKTDEAFRAAEKARHERYYAAHPEARAKACKKWADKNRDALHASYAARLARLKRDQATWTAWRIEHWWLPRWKIVAQQGPEAIARYLKRAREDARKAFVAWYARENLLDTGSGLGHVPTVFDEDVHERG